MAGEGGGVSRLALCTRDMAGKGSAVMHKSATADCIPFFMQTTGGESRFYTQRIIEDILLFLL
jgi:hypothetical protein